jgi:prepilin-type N-terminal cleavage/methylation domain-containing protein
MHPKHSERVRRNAGFTLLEVIVALALMTFVVGGICAIANGAVQLGSSLAVARLREARVNAVVGALRVFFETLPMDAELSLDKEGSLVVGDAGSPFGWNSKMESCRLLKILIVPGEKPNISVLVARHQWLDGGDSVDVILFPMIRESLWSFSGGRGQAWQSVLDSSDARPRIIKWRYAQPDLPGVQEVVFRLAPKPFTRHELTKEARK